jgi:hypothetical protein
MARSSVSNGSPDISQHHRPPSDAEGDREDVDRDEGGDPRADDWEWSSQSWPWFRLDSAGEALAPSVALLR